MNCYCNQPFKLKRSVFIVLYSKKITYYIFLFFKYYTQRVKLSLYLFLILIFCCAQNRDNTMLFFPISFYNIDIIIITIIFRQTFTL